MRRFVEGADRKQATLFPECLDDWIAEDNPVRVIDAFIDRLDLGELGRRLAPAAAEVRNNDFLLRFRVPPYELTVFADGRAIVKGTKDPAVARSLYARYIGA